MGWLRGSSLGGSAFGAVASASSPFGFHQGSPKGKKGAARITPPVVPMKTEGASAQLWKSSPWPSGQPSPAAIALKRSSGRKAPKKRTKPRKKGATDTGFVVNVRPPQSK